MRIFYCVKSISMHLRFLCLVAVQIRLKKQNYFESGILIYKSNAFIQQAFGSFYFAWLASVLKVNTPFVFCAIFVTQKEQLCEVVSCFYTLQSTMMPNKETKKRTTIVEYTCKKKYSKKKTC